MPPKKDTAGAGGDPNELITGFNARDTRLLAAAMISQMAPGKWDYKLMGTLTGNTPGSLQKMWPGVKQKAIDLHPSFGAFLSQGPGARNVVTTSTTTESKAKAKGAGGRKRKADSTDHEAASDDEEETTKMKGGEKKKNGKGGNEKMAGKGKGRAKKVKTKTEVKDERERDPEADDSADGGDGLDDDSE